MAGDRKSTRLNSSHLVISYAVFCLKKKREPQTETLPPILAIRLDDSTVAGSFVYRSNVFQSIFERPNTSLATTRRSSFRRAAEGLPVPVCGAFPDSSGAWD